MKTGDKSETPLIFSDIQYNTTDYKNTALAEADKIVQFVKMNRDKTIGVITLLPISATAYKKRFTKLISTA